MNPSWNLIAYYPSFELDASAPDFYVLGDIIDRVVIAKDVNGNFLNPEFRFSNMPPWRSTQGYWIKIEGDDPLIFRYPEQAEELASVSEERSNALPDHWNSTLNTGENMSVLVNSLYETQVADGDRIIAYNTSGSIVGEGEILNGQCGLAVWGDDPTTDVVDGLSSGESFTLSVWDLKNNASSELEVIQIRTGTSLNYESNGFVVLDLTASNAIPDEYYLAQNYPNPFNSMTSCKFGLPEAGKLTIAVFDISGRLVTTLVDTEMPAGTHSIRWNASSTAAGMYFIQMAASGFETTRKVTLLK